MFDLNIPEEELKNKVAMEFFSDFDCTQILGEIDFCVSFEMQSFFEDTYFLWAEAKKGKDADIYESFTQLLLTIAKHKHHQKHNPPPFLGAFDAEKIAFIEYSKLMEFLDRSDFDYLHTTPSNHDGANFQKMHAQIKGILQSQISLFYFGKDNDEIKEFIKTNFALNNANLTQIPITEDNFVHIYIKWLNAVKPSIDIDWSEAKKQGILDTDFYLADMLSVENKTLKDKLYIILEGSRYALLKGKNKIGLFEKSEVLFNDSQVAHKQFWNRYERPPAEKFWNKFINRRDLLVPEDIRERKGAFYTPYIWVKKAQEYLADCLGENWQDEYYIWDCCAGTGNLLAGLKNARNIYASTLDRADVNIMKDLVRTNEKSIKLNLLENHIFEFDFLNDSFFDKVDSKGNIIAESKLPKSLQEILSDSQKRKKLVIFINPPYAEAGSAKQVTGTGANKIAVATKSRVYEQYSKDIDLGLAIRELFAQFFVRIYKEIPNCILGSFSTLKYVNASGFINFRDNMFKAKFLKGFAIPAWTFDNVKGDFPIGFLVWNLAEKMDIKKIKVDIFNEHNKRIGKKNFYAPKHTSKNDNKITISQWITSFEAISSDILAFTGNNGPDVQNNKYLFLNNTQLKLPNGALNNATKYNITKYNLIPICVYFAVRKALKTSWINDRDQFLYPNKKWQDDKEFHSDCLTFTLFHRQNRISANLLHPKSLPQGEGFSSHSHSLAEMDKGGGLKYINHFIPFSEVEVGAKEAFKSDFMVRFINGKVKNGALENCFIPSEKIEFSLESKAVFKAGLELWRYYHKCAKNSDSYLNDASLYDIKEHFQGRNENGKMNNKSTDSHYNDLIAQLRIALNALATKIEPKIYEYEFLRE